MDHHFRRWIAILAAFSGILPNAFAIGATQAAEVVKAEIKQESAWTGQPVLLIVTLYSPGPFSGTASFSLPELPRTAILKESSPVVGSETIDGESWFTQRHELTIFTQQVGEIVLPAFEIRFAGKKTFTSDAEPMQGKTPELRFQSKRPPGTDQMDFVVAAEEIQFSQQWLPADQDSVAAGDVIQRTVTRNAEGTVSMMLTPIEQPAMEGIRIYQSDPVVTDKSNRGESTAQRIDIIKYQFQRGGAFELPGREFIWWDTNAEELKVAKLPGLSVSVAAPPPTADESSMATNQPPNPNLFRWLVLSLVAAVGGAFIARQLLTKWQAYRSHPETMARQRLKSACGSNNTADAYAAMVAWKQAAGCEAFPKTPHGSSLQTEFERLAARLFAKQADDSPWSGQSLWSRFHQVRSEMARGQKEITAPSDLPQLNPTDQA